MRFEFVAPVQIPPASIIDSTRVSDKARVNNPNYIRAMSVAVSRPSSSISHSFDRHLPNYDDDPLTAALAPPPDETAEQRELREAAEAEARRVSDEIDEQLRNERMALKKKKAPVKVLLLGQSESGASRL